MERRRFLQLAGLAGLSVLAPLAARKVSADPGKYPGPYWVMVNASGGWDPTMFCDPKGGKAMDPTAVNQGYTAGQIGKVGSFRFAPLDYQVNNISVYDTARFFNTHHRRLRVFNGVDTTTNNHDAGSRTVWSGQLAEGYPSLAALIAGVATESSRLSMAFLSYGGYDVTEDCVALTRVGGVDSLQKLAHPNVIDPSKADSPTYSSPATATRIAAAQAARLTALRQGAPLPSLQAAMSSLFLARQNDGGLQALAAELTGKKLVTIDDIPDLAGIQDRNQVRDLEGLMQQAELSIYAFKAGVAVSANLEIGGFDTHSDHDNRQGSQVIKLLRGLDYLFGQLDAAGIADKTYVLVGSDFGRTPYYNQGNGKDHWNITSVLAAGPGIAGDRTIGSTDAGFKPNTVNMSTLAPDPAGIRIGTNHLHLALRKLAKVDGSDLAARYPIAADDLPLFA